MGELVAKWMKHQNRKDDRPRGDNLTPEESRNLKKLQQLAKDKGATLASGGKGGLSPSLALHVFKRDGYRCKSCGGKDDLTLHHKGGIVESKWLSKKGHSNDPDNIAVLCGKCHDRIHEEAKAKGIDSSQVTPEGDEGTRRDHGKPPAHPKE